MKLHVNVNNHITLHPKVSEASEIWTRKERRSGDLGRESRARTRPGSVWDGHSETMSWSVWLRRKGWSSSEKTRNKEGNESLQPEDGPSRLNPSQGGWREETDNMASDEAPKNTHSHNILSETILFWQPWVHIMDQFLFPRYSLRMVFVPPGLHGFCASWKPQISPGLPSSSWLTDILSRGWRRHCELVLIVHVPVLLSDLCSVRRLLSALGPLRFGWRVASVVLEQQGGLDSLVPLMGCPWHFLLSSCPE